MARMVPRSVVDDVAAPEMTPAAWKRKATTASHRAVGLVPRRAAQPSSKAPAPRLPAPIRQMNSGAGLAAATAAA